MGALKLAFAPLLSILTTLATIRQPINRQTTAAGRMLATDRPASADKLPETARN
jgi:hypothetical protein